MVGIILQWIARWQAGYPISRNLDDFFTSHNLQQVCDRIMQTIHDTCEEVGVLMSEEKRVFATQVIKFLGLLIDTLLMIIQVPTAKQKDILQYIQSVLSNQSVSAANLQSFAGKLNFLVKAFPLGCLFIHWLYNSAAGKHPCRQVQVSKDIKKDLQLWGAFLIQFGGLLPILDTAQCKQATLVVYSDALANPNLGWGVYIPSNRWWSYGQWDAEFVITTSPSIDFLKMYVVLIFLDMKGVDLRDSIIYFKSDNQPTLDTLTNKTSKSPHLMTTIRVIVLICLNYNIRFTISYVTGCANVYVDHLSQSQIPKFLNCVDDIESLQFWKLQT